MDPALPTASLDKTARVWDATTGRPISPPLQHDQSVDRVVFSPDGRTVATASTDLAVRVWDAVSGVAVSQPLRHTAAVLRLAFTPDGRRGW